MYEFHFGKFSWKWKVIIISLFDWEEATFYLKLSKYFAETMHQILCSPFPVGKHSFNKHIRELIQSFLFNKRRKCVYFAKRMYFYRYPIISPRTADQHVFGKWHRFVSSFDCIWGCLSPVCPTFKVIIKEYLTESMKELRTFRRVLQQSKHMSFINISNTRIPGIECNLNRLEFSASGTHIVDVWLVQHNVTQKNTSCRCWKFAFVL